jgi:hypothetical protein
MQIIRFGYTSRDVGRKVDCTRSCVMQPRWAAIYATPLTLSLRTSYIYGALCKARNFNVVYIWTYF